MGGDEEPLSWRGMWQNLWGGVGRTPLVTGRKTALLSWRVGQCETNSGGYEPVLNDILSLAEGRAPCCCWCVQAPRLYLSALTTKKSPLLPNPQRGV